MAPAVFWSTDELVEIGEVVRTNPQRLTRVPKPEHRDEDERCWPPHVEPRSKRAEQNEKHGICRQNMAMADIQMACQRNHPVNHEQHEQRRGGAKLRAHALAPRRG